MPQKHPTTERTGGPGASHENRKEPEKSKPHGRLNKPHSEQGNTERIGTSIYVRIPYLSWYVPRVLSESAFWMQTLRFRVLRPYGCPRRRGSAPPISFTSADMAGPAVTRDTTSQRPSRNGR